MTTDNIKLAMKGDINAFHSVFADFKDELKSFLYRLVADRNDAEDLTHDTFVKAFDKISTFKNESTIKTWVFTIATHLAYDFLKKRNRWAADILDQAKETAGKHKYVRDYLKQSSEKDVHGRFDLAEHIDFCFTCISKTIPIEQQVALILTDIYDFKAKEVAVILNKGESAVKHYIRIARETMIDIFDNRCALVNKKGVCHQCSQLNNWLNPKQNFQVQKMKIELIKQAGTADKKELFRLREDLVKNINPLKADGSDLHESFMKLHRMCAGEIQTL